MLLRRYKTKREVLKADVKEKADTKEKKDGGDKKASRK